jgi:sulfhydrogenase subunit delta
MVRKNAPHLSPDKPTIGIYGFTGCAGDQLLILHTEDEILNLFNAADISSFTMASSNPIDGKLDVALIEGSISTEEEKEHIQEIRKRATILVAIGNCAVLGGPQAMYAKDSSFDQRMRAVYGDVKFITGPLESTPIDQHVTVDYYLPGCPISQKQAMPLLSRLIHGLDPEEYPHPVCHECKLNENTCFLNAHEFCLGPLTKGGCGSVCINHGLPCVGCWGPHYDGNFSSHLKLLEEFGLSRDEIMRRVRNYGGYRILRYLDELQNDEVRK